MKLSINTKKLQEMLARAVVGASNNKMFPLTGMISIKLENHRLTLTTTDNTNFLYIISEDVEGDYFAVVLEVDKFSKLISRMTSDKTTLEVINDSLEITGNGKYKLELPLDEGEFVHYPDPVSAVTFDEEPTYIDRAVIEVILGTNKAALATAIENLCYTGYYVGDKVISTDTYKICGLDMKLFDSDKLISPEMMDMLDVMGNEKIGVFFDSGNIIFRTSDCIVYGPELDGIDEFAIEPISNLLEGEFKSVCKLPKSEVMGVLDRINLFVGAYDKNGIYLTFTEKGLQISSKVSSGVELVPYNEVENFSQYTCYIDIEMLRTQIKAQDTGMIELHYNNESNNAIKMVDGNITQIIALIEEDEA